MDDTISSNRKIAKNTVFLYFRMMFTMMVSLYTSRVNLRVLGIEDNGIYQVVGGTVAIFGFLNSSLSGATSRFLTYELGRGDKQKLNDTFATSLNIHILVAIIIFVLAETIGLWLLECKLVIPANRMNAARVVFQLSIIASMIAVTQVPYNASIISHERMGVFAYMSILDVSLKLLICYILYVTPFDSLITYAVLVLTVSITTQTIYRSYCIRHFDECHFRWVRKPEIFRPISSFAFWDILGNFSIMARSQGVNMILNMFFGPAINAAAGFSTTISNNVYAFSNNFLTAIRPPITKAYSQSKYEKMEELMISASKYSFALLFLLSAPFIFESRYILELWLQTPPEYTDIFCILELIATVISVIFLPLMFAIHASGKIRAMSFVNGTIWLAVVPITYIILKCGYSPTVPYITKCFLYVFVITANFYFTKKNIPAFNIMLYLRKAFMPSFVTVCVVLSFTYIVYIQFEESGIIRFIVTCTSSTVSVILSIYFIVFDKHNREKVINFILGKIEKH